MYKLISNFFFLLILCVISGNAQTPPDQPAAGPGGQDYRHAGVQSYGPFWPEGREGQEAFEYWIYQPSLPAPPEAPAILFLHGKGAVSPVVYESWIAHLAKKGFSVIWVRYESSATILPEYLGNAVESYRHALERIERQSTAFVPVTRDDSGALRTGIVGHSLGGALAVLLAGRSERMLKAPAPAAVFAIEPALAWLEPSDFSSYPAKTKTLIVVAEDDAVVCKSGAELLWRLVKDQPPANRQLLVVHTDRWGTPALTADHPFPTTAGVLELGVDARDYYVTWKLSVAAMNCGMFNIDCESSFSGGGPAQVDMGSWSDGKPVIPMTCIPSPESVQLKCEQRRTRLRRR